MRLALDKKFIRNITDFVNFTSNEDIIKDVHRYLTLDMDLASVVDRYDDLINLEFPEKTPKNYLCYLCSIKTSAYSEISILVQWICYGRCCQSKVVVNSPTSSTEDVGNIIIYGFPWANMASMHYYYSQQNDKAAND